MFQSADSFSKSLRQQLAFSDRFPRIRETVMEQHHEFHAEIEESIRVLNWNIAKNNHNPQWTRDFLTILLHYSPNLIFLQEVRWHETTEYVTGLAELSWSFAPNFVDTLESTYFGILTAARAKQLSRQSILTRHHEPVTKTPKVSLITEYALADSTQPLLVVNTHLINFVSLHKFRDQLHDLEQVISRHDGPIVFSGDFNTWNHTRGHLLQSLAARLGLTQVTFEPQDHQQIKRFLLSPPLDYIFYRGLQVKPFTAKVLHEVTSSDHKPLLVEFSCEESMKIC